MPCMPAGRHVSFSQFHATGRRFFLLSSCCWYTGDKFPLEKVHEAVAETARTGRKGKVFLEG